MQYTGKQTWIFHKPPMILAGAAIGGPEEKQGALKESFDSFYDDLWFNQASYEKAEQKLQEEAARLAMRKANRQADFYIAGDLQGQIVASDFTARVLDIPYFGIFAACATILEALGLAALFVETHAANNVLIAASSHTNSAEKEFRYPNEYGVQKTPTSQRTVTAAGAAMIGYGGDTDVFVRSVTIGRVVDMGITDPTNLGAAMAPAVADSLRAHFTETHTTPADYDMIVTGDLGEIGQAIVLDLLKRKGYALDLNRCMDCGLKLFHADQDVFSGGSGPGCVAAVTCGYILNNLRGGLWQKVLVAASGALFSPISYQQHESIAGISHVVCLTKGDGA